MKVLFYETVYDDAKYITVGVTRSGFGATNFEDLRGYRACFPEYDGVAWNSVMYTLRSKHLLDTCPLIDGMANFFGPSCVPDLPVNGSSNLKEICNGNEYRGEYGALKCLFEKKADIAFVSKNSLYKFINGKCIIITNYKKRTTFKKMCFELIHHNVCSRYKRK